MRVGVPVELREGERRVALVPEAVSRLVDAGLEVVVQAGAGRHAFAPDDAYREAGATVADGDVLADSDVVLSVSPLSVDQARTLRPGTVTLSFLPVGAEADLVQVLRDHDVLAFSMEQVPRISRAQSMDALSSQALVAGYRAALVAAERLPRFFPLFMTAAGTVAPAKVLVLGAGVAGLQAIATARRLGAVVEAYDVRAVVGRRGPLDGRGVPRPRPRGAGGRRRLRPRDGRGAGAAPARPAHAVRRRERRRHHDRRRARPAGAAAADHRHGRDDAAGSVVVDLAAESGGNCELSRPGEDVRHGDVLVWGAATSPRRCRCTPASSTPATW